MSGNARLRLSKDIVLSSKLNQNLKKLLGEFDTEELNDLPDYQKSFNAQLSKYKDSFNFLLASFPPNKNEVKTSPENMKRAVDKAYQEQVERLSKLEPDSSFNDFQEVLVDFNQKLLNIMGDYWEGHDKELIEYLNLAEQYVTSAKGRRDLASLSKLDIDGEEFLVLMYEEVISPCNAKFIDEVFTIQKTAWTELPDWYENLSSAIQGLITYLDKEECSTDLLRRSLYSISDQLKKTDNLQADLESIEAENSALPLWFVELDNAQKIFIRRILREEGTSVDLFHRQLNLSIEQVNNLNDIKDVHGPLNKVYCLPEWYQGMNTVERHFFLHKIKDLETEQDVERAFQYIPSKWRTVPLLANFARSHTTFFSLEGEILHQSIPRIRSTHIASREVLDQSIEAQDRHPNDNIKTIIKRAINSKIEKHVARFGEKPQEIPLLLQTLISPIKPLRSTIPDIDLDEQKIRAVHNIPESYDGVKLKPFSTNHPFNYARYWEYTGKTFSNLTESDKQCKELLGYVTDYIFNASNSLLQAAKFKLSKTVYDEEGLQHYINKVTNEKIIFKSRLSALEIEKLTSVVDQLEKAGDFDESQSSRIAFKIIDILQGNATLDSVLDDDNFNDKSCFPRDKAIKAEKIISFICSNLNKSKKSFGSDPSVLKAFLRQELITKLSANQLNSGHRKLVDEHITSMLGEYDVLLSLKGIYEKTLNSSIGTATIYDYNGRELFLSSLEQLIVSHLNGIAHCTCVSGKDRTAIESLQTSGMEGFFTHNRKIYWPEFNDRSNSIERQRLVDIVAQLYLTRHHIVHAGENSSGSDGIKTPDMYFPSDICQRINGLASAKHFNKYVYEAVFADIKSQSYKEEFKAYQNMKYFSDASKDELLSFLSQLELSEKVQSKVLRWYNFKLTKEDDEIATNNELRRIGVPQQPSARTFYMSRRNRFSITRDNECYRLKAREIKSPQRLELLKAIKQTSQQTGFWNEKVSWSSSWLIGLPTQIGEIQKSISNSSKESIVCLSNIFKILDKARKSDSKRNEFTKHYYQLILSVFDAKNSNIAVTNALAGLQTCLDHMTGKYSHIQATKIKADTREELISLIQETTKTPNEKWYSSLGSLNYWSNGPDTVISINKAINSSSSKSSEEVLEAVFKILLEAEKGGYSRNGLTSTYYRNLLKVYYSDIYHDSDPQIAAVAAINYLKSFKQAYYEDTQTNGPVAVL